MNQLQFTDFEIEALISESTISELYPWNTDDENLIDQFYKTIFSMLHEKLM